MAGCLRTADVEPVVVAWTFRGGDTLGCEAGREDVPVMRIRSHVAVSPAADDEYIDWVPCATEDAVLGIERFEGAITPLELGTYDVEVEMWTADRFWRIAHQGAPGLAILNSPTDVATVNVEMIEDLGGYDPAAAGAL
jgi:hypothetical protein